MGKRGLKPCPWCGSGPILREDKLWKEYSYNERTVTHRYVGSYEYYYECSNKECEAIAPHGKYNTIYKTAEEAIKKAKEAWQSRPDDEE